MSQNPDILTRVSQKIMYNAINDDKRKNETGLNAIPLCCVEGFGRGSKVLKETGICSTVKMPTS